MISNNYLKEDFKTYERDIDNLKHKHGDEFDFIFSNYNAVLRLFGFDTNFYYIYKYCSQYSFNYYVRHKSNNNIEFKINFDYHYNLTIHCEASYESNDESQLEDINLLFQNEFKSVAQHLKEYEIKEHIKKRSRIYKKSDGNYKLVSKRLKEYFSDDLFKFEYLIANIICQRDFQNTISLKDYYFIESFNLDLFNTLHKSGKKKIENYKSLFIFKDGCLTEESKELFKLNYNI